MYSEISLILIQCDIRYGYLAYVNDCHMTENWMLQTCVFIQSMTGTNSVVCSYGKFQPGRPKWIQETQPKWWNITCIVRDCHSFVESCNFTNKDNLHTSKEELHTRPKLCRFGLYVVDATLFCLKSFAPVTGLECSYGKIFIPVTEISVAKTEISVIG